MEEPTPWHRLFGMMLMDFFAASAFHVEYEKDLSFKAQRLDIVIVRKDAHGFVPELPDGMRDSLTTHNLISFKSYQDTLNDWTLKELTGHYVNYRKQVSPSMNDLLPEEEFQLFALSARYPQGLADEVPLTEVQEGVYDCRRGTDVIRIVVSNRLPLDPHNSPLHLFSGQDERISFGVTNFSQRTDETSTLLARVFDKYRLEGVEMPQTNEEFRREFFSRFPLKERLAGASPSEVLKEFTPEERLKDLSPTDLLQALPPEVLEVLRKNLEERSAGSGCSPGKG